MTTVQRKPAPATVSACRRPLRFVAAPGSRFGGQRAGRRKVPSTTAGSKSAVTLIGTVW